MHQSNLKFALNFEINLHWSTRIIERLTELTVQWFLVVSFLNEWFIQLEDCLVQQRECQPPAQPDGGTGIMREYLKLYGTICSNLWPLPYVYTVDKITDIKTSF